MSSSGETIVFLHIPKTGGATLHKILERNYARDQVLTFNGRNHPSEIDDFKRLPETQRAQYRLIKGHARFGLHRFVPGESSYITFLREPIARAVSFYHYARSHPEHYLHREITENRATLKNLLQRNATPEFFNLQTRMIAADEWNDLQREVDANALERAQQNLQSHFSFVGFTEEFDASLALLCRARGWSVPFYVKRNVTAGKPRTNGVDAETRALLRDANTLDTTLYEYARELFEAKRREVGAEFESQLCRFQRLNRICACGYESYNAIWRTAVQLVRRYSARPCFETLRQTASGSI